MMNGITMLACRRAGVLSRRRLIPSSSSSSRFVGDVENGRSWYSSTTIVCDEDGGGGENVATKKVSSTKPDKKQLRQIALEYGRRKANYKRQVSKLRKSYMEEYQRHVAEDEALQEAEQAETTRKRLERQRTKNLKSVENAIRQKELQRQAHLAFQDHLKVEQEKREAKEILFNKARQLCIDELEEEAPLWLTTPEEVEAAFTPEAEQLLWGRPQGVIGAPNPTLDSHFWSYETHTWDMSKTYKTSRDLLLEHIEDEVYEKTNLDPNFWTKERIEEYEALERKAKLRANVRQEGRKQLLKRQQEMLEEDNETKPGDPPKPAPVPSLGVLANIKAQEKEGSERLFKDPTKFFIFDNDKDGDDDMDASNDDEYSGPSLGSPVELKDPLRAGGDPKGDVFPVGIGKLPKADTRSESEKKREEREQRLWAAAQGAAAAAAEEAGEDPDESLLHGEPLDYDNNTDYDSDDEEWMKGLDPDADSDVMNVPPEFRYREDDIDWVIEQLKEKTEDLESHFRSTVNSIEQNKRAQMMATEGDDNDDNEGTGQELSAEEALAGAATAIDGDGDDDGSSGRFFDEESAAKLRSVGGDVDKFENLMSSLSEEQLLTIYSLDGKKESDITKEEGESIFATIEGLSEQQIADLTELDRLSHEAENQDADNDLF